MPFDPGLAERLEAAITSRFAHVDGLKETRMFGGFGYLLNGNMCLGIHKDMLIIRVGAEAAEQVMQDDGIGPMDITGKAMKGWAMAQPEALAEDENLVRYCDLAITFVSGLPAKD